MAVQIQFITIVIPIDRINGSTEPGGFPGLLDREYELLGKRFWYDEHLYATAVMSPSDAQHVIEEWERKGLVGRTGNDESRQWKDLCVVDYYHGPTLPCDWLDGDVASHTVWLKGTEPGRVAKPERQHEASPVLITPEMVQKLGKHMRIVGASQRERKPWWKLW